MDLFEFAVFITDAPLHIGAEPVGNQCVFDTILPLRQHHHHPHTCHMPFPKQMHLIRAGISNKTARFLRHFAILAF